MSLLLHFVFDGSLTHYHRVPLIYSGVNGILDSVPVAKVGQWEADLIAHLKSNEQAMLDQIDKEGALSKDLEKKLKQVLTDFTKNFS